MQDRILQLCELSPTLRTSLGRRSLLPPDLKTAAEEVLLPRESIGLTFIDENRFDKQGFRARIYQDNDSYNIQVNQNTAFFAKWYLIGHEYGHLFFHKDLLNSGKFPFEGETQDLILEEQADFFAQLIFWPILTLSDKWSTLPDRGEYQIILDLVKFAKRKFSNDPTGREISDRRLRV